MKKRYMVALLIILAFLGGCGLSSQEGIEELVYETEESFSQETINETDEKSGLDSFWPTRGVYLVTKQTTYDFIGTTVLVNSYSESGKWLNTVCTVGTDQFEFNQYGYAVMEYAIGQNTIMIDEYVLDDNNNIITWDKKFSMDNKDGDTKFRWTYSYKQNGERERGTQMLSVFESGEWSDVYTVEYDYEYHYEDGKLRSLYMKSNDSSAASIQLDFTYDESGLLRTGTSASINEDGTKTVTAKMTLTYDEYNNVIKKELVSSNEMHSYVIEYEYTFYNIERTANMKGSSEELINNELFFINRVLID